MSLASIKPERSAQGEAPRRRGRTSLCIPVGVRSGGVTLAGVTHNISREGAFVATPEPLPIGEKVTLRLVAPRYSLPLVLRAEVRWSRPVTQVDGDQMSAGIGVEFVDPPIGVSLCLAALLEDQDQEDDR
jgi:Tfp pilus assembly protein PilZ